MIALLILAAIVGFTALLTLSAALLALYVYTLYVLIRDIAHHLAGGCVVVPRAEVWR